MTMTIQPIEKVRTEIAATGSWSGFIGVLAPHRETVTLAHNSFSGAWRLESYLAAYNGDTGEIIALKFE